ncbi:hypothetical protein N9K75_03040 [bacterium]|nr:hypothetical protein [bacterium]
MWLAIGVVVFCYVAWCSGEHHADRALRIVKHNRPERTKKWRDMERAVRCLQTENKNLRDLIKGVKR